LQENEYIRYDDLPLKTKGGKLIQVEFVSNVYCVGEEKVIQCNIRDITARKRAEEKIQRQLEHLTALRAIDRVIAANFDLNLSLAEILTHVTKELRIDAADILILNTNSQMLEYSAEYGFRTQVTRRMPVRLGEGYAGRAALERQTIQIPNLKDEPQNSSLITFLSDEKFVCYYGVPLIAKGQVKGVLEVFHRAALQPNTDWFDFLNALAGQAALAIENAMLFESLQRSNSELTIAYDATIEGWSRALDLRDQETEWHTQRVTAMTVKLGRAFGLNEIELMQVRWGALLHDIGKMGIPDGILYKAGPLTEAEWVAMKKHPTFAYELLAPIRYLRLALDIPYCHHEKWDGSGYPHGLKGNQIPLFARIFAVVDVWDALNSDRPYRAAWIEEKVREHIWALSGTYFDPQVVDVFMQIPH
jgi:HD-GYP domain-containing protein (c-di-GMP phosphodiesterase class II)